MIPKYRAWDKDAECMIYQKDNGDEYIWEIGVNDIWMCYVYDGEIPEQVLMQFTGLKDKHSVEIFDGDIMYDETNDVYGRVRFDEGKFVYEEDGICFDLCEVASDLPVVGNIFENPDLLESEK